VARHAVGRGRKGWIVKRKKVAGAGDPRFTVWWESLPPGWQEGLLTALHGGAAECELLHPDRSPAVYVFFASPDLASALRQTLLDTQ
jgi:hypothetical protein